MATKKEQTSKGLIKDILSKAWEKAKELPRKLRGTKANVEERARERIAEKTGRSKKQIKDIEKGKRPGKNLLDSLKQMKRGRKVTAPPKEEKKAKARKKLTPEEIAAKAKAEAEAKAKAELEAKRRELQDAAAGGITVTVTGKMGTSKDFRNRTVSADLEPDDALEFLMLRETNQQAALDFFFEHAYGAPLTVERLDSLTVS